MTLNLIATASALALSAPALSKTIDVTPGEGAQGRLQEALITAQPGDVVQLAPGRFALTDGLSLDVAGVTVRGAGMDASVLDFTGQQGAGEGLLVTAKDVTLRDFAVENTKGDGIKSKGADNVVYYRVRVTWTGGPKESNGAYGIYPVSSTGVLVDNCEVSGASDAGIYVGQSKAITVRNSLVRFNVAGIEIENSRNARVTGNMVTRNTGGILVFDLPNLPVKGGGEVQIDHNLVLANDTPNFAPKGNIVAGVPTGTGVMVMANSRVTVDHNVLAENGSAQIMVVAYPNMFSDKDYYPYPQRIEIGANNSFQRGGGAPAFAGGRELAAALGGALPPVVWDGLGPTGKVLTLGAGVTGVNLNLPKQGAAPTEAKPGLIAGPPLHRTATGEIVVDADGPAGGAPAALDARIAG